MITIPKPTLKIINLKSAKIRFICCMGASYLGGPSMTVIVQKNPDLKVTVVDFNI